MSKSVEYFCDLPVAARKGTLLACDCGKFWYCKPYGAQWNYGDWAEISAERYAELSGEAASPPKRRRSLRAWWREKFLLDRYPQK